MAEPLQRACPCGGGCPNCQTEQAGHERLPTKRVQASDMGQIAAPPIVHEVLAGPGEPLDLATRGFFEPRFGYDLGTVRVHTDMQAGQSAQVVHGVAYTVGQHLVFGASQYAPHSNEGRRLLAHELTHVLQQQSSGVRALQSSPQEEKSEPSKNLVPPGPGKYSPRDYEQWLKKHPKREYKIGGPWEPDFLYNRYTPKWFADHGYFYAGRGGVEPYYWFEIWLNDTGDGAEFRVWRTADGRGITAASTQTNDEPPVTPGEKVAAKFPPFIDPNADHEKLFGPVIAERLDVDHALGEGDMLRHTDGTVVLHLKGTTKSIVLRPVPNDKDLYILYWENGRRDRMPYTIPPSELPDPIKDASE